MYCSFYSCIIWPLWKYKNKVHVKICILYFRCLKEISKSQSLIENFNINDKFAKAKMYDFHFSNSPYVSILCEVTVCKSLKSSGCLKSEVRIYDITWNEFETKPVTSKHIYIWSVFVIYDFEYKRKYFARIVKLDTQ